MIYFLLYSFIFSLDGLESIETTLKGAVLVIFGY